MFLSDPPAPDLAAALYDEDRASGGYVSNTARLQGWRPDVLEAFLGVRSTLTGGSELSPAGLAVRLAATAAARSGSYCGLAWGTRLAGDAPAAVRAAVSYGRAPAGVPPV